MVWLWGFLARVKWADRLFGVFSILIIILTGVALSLWTTWGGDLVYSATWLEFTGNVISVLVAILGIVWLVTRRPTGWGYGIASLLIMTLGYLFQLSGINPPSDFSGVVRLAQLVAFPLLLVLPHNPFRSADEHKQSDNRYGADPVTLRALAALASETYSQNNLRNSCSSCCSSRSG